MRIEFIEKKTLKANRCEEMSNEWREGGPDKIYAVIKRCS